MKTFIKTHKKLSITFGITLLLLLVVLIWFQMRVGFRNLPLYKIGATIEDVRPLNNSEDTFYIKFKLDDASSWPNYEYATTHYNYNIDNLKEGDKIYMLCNGNVNTSSPPELSVFFMWKR